MNARMLAVSSPFYKPLCRVFIRRADSFGYIMKAHVALPDDTICGSSADGTQLNPCCGSGAT